MDTWRRKRTSMDIEHLQPGFTYLLLERVNPDKNENRFYYLAWPLQIMVQKCGRRSLKTIIHCSTSGC
jgi:hypothetical protein